MTKTETEEIIKSKKVPTDQSGGKHSESHGEDGHMGATEDEVASIPAPSGSAFDDEPKQG